MREVTSTTAVAPLIEERARAAGLADRLGFAGGDFLAGPLPEGYDVLSFVRLLHDWPAGVARTLLEKAKQVDIRVLPGPFNAVVATRV